MKVDAFWLVFCGIAGIASGAAFYQKTQKILLLLCEILYHRAWLSLGIVLVVTTAFFMFKFLIKKEKIQVETILSEQKYNELKKTVDHAMAVKNRNYERINTSLQNQRQRLQKATGSVYIEADNVQKDAIAIIHFVDQVQDLLGRRSEKLLNELPKSPIKIKKILERDKKLQNELNDLLQNIGNVFPDIAGSIHKIEPIVNQDYLEVLDLEKIDKNSKRVAEYKPKRIKKGLSS